MRYKMSILSVSLLLPFFLSLTACAQDSKVGGVFPIESVSAGSKGGLPNITWMQDGTKMSLAEVMKTKVVFLNFWATWCGPCRHEIPDIIQLSKDYAGKDVVVIGISLDQDPKALAMVKKFADLKGITYINLVDSKGEVADAVGGIASIPTTFVLKKGGEVSDRLIGARSKAEFEEAVKKAQK